MDVPISCTPKWIQPPIFGDISLIYFSVTYKSRSYMQSFCFVVSKRTVPWSLETGTWSFESDCDNSIFFQFRNSSRVMSRRRNSWQCESHIRRSFTYFLLGLKLACRLRSRSMFRFLEKSTKCSDTSLIWSIVQYFRHRNGELYALCLFYEQKKRMQRIGLCVLCKSFFSMNRHFSSLISNDIYMSNYCNLLAQCIDAQYYSFFISYSYYIFTFI